MAQITWTVVTRKNGRGQFQKTGFEGTWHEATDEAQRIGREAADKGITLDVWYVTTDDTKVLVSVSGERDRWVTIAPTKAEKAAAKAEEARIEAVAQDMLNSWAKDRLLGVAHAVVRDFTGTTPLAAAYALARAGWDRRAVGRRLS